MRLAATLLLLCSALWAQNPGTNATMINGAKVPPTHPCVGTNAAGQIIPATCIGTLPTTAEPISNPGTSQPYSYVQGATGSVGRTQTNKNRDVVSLLDFGADPSGVTPATAAVQAWINKLTPQGTNLGGYGYCPAGTYLIDGTVTIQNVNGLVLLGSSSCTFHWAGASTTTPMFDLQDVAHSMFVGFKVLGDSSHQLESAFLLENITGTAVTPTSNVFENLFIAGVNGYIDYGFRISASGTGGDNNNDFHQFINVHVNDYAIAGWSLEALQAHFIKMSGSYCLAANGIGKYCVSNGASAGAATSFVWDGGGSFNNTLADFALTCNPSSQPYVLRNFSSEGSNRMIDSPGGNCGSGSALIVQGARWSDNGINADGYAIKYANPGPVHIIGSTIGESMSNAIKIHWTYVTPGNPPGFVFETSSVKGTLNTPSTIFDANLPTDILGSSAVTAPFVNVSLDLINVNGFKVTNDGNIHLDFSGLQASFDNYSNLQFSGWTAYPNLFDLATAFQMDWNSDVMLSYAGAGSHKLRVTDRFDATKFDPFEAEVITSHGTSSDPGCASVTDVGKFWTDTTTTTTALKYCKNVAGTFNWSSIVLP